jgi:hypothetical protein
MVNLKRFDTMQITNNNSNNKINIDYLELRPKKQASTQGSKLLKRYM